MDKLVITITCDSTMSYPRSPYNPKGVEALAEEYVRSVNAGASICHLHGPYTVDETIRPDGTKLSDLDVPGWQRLKDLITSRVRPIIQYGIANGRFPQRVELYGIHDRQELENYCRLTKQYDVKPEVESFHYGAIWNAQRMIMKGILETPVWTTFFLGWPGGCWTPSTVKAMQYTHEHKPEHFEYSVSDMDPPTHWLVLTPAILLGGHVRVGMEDSPYLDAGQTFAQNNAQLVEKAVRIAHEVGRDIASPEEAKFITGLAPRGVPVGQ